MAVTVTALTGCSTSTSVSAASPSAGQSSASSTSSPSSVSPSPSATPSTTATPSPSPSVVKAASCPHRFSQAALVTCIKTAEAVYLATWTKDLAALGITGAKPPRIVIFPMIPKNPCISNEGDAAEASFWCGKNNTLYVSANAAKTWTVYYAKAAADHHVLASDAATVGTPVADLRGGYPLVGATTEFAHEMGHWAQQVSGQMSWYDKAVANPDFAASSKAEATREGAADCLAGWMHGRTALDGTWVDTAIGRWAHHATMAELGYDLETVKPHFTFAKEKPADVMGYGTSYTRLKFYDMGYAAGRSGKPGLSTCSRAVATYLSAPLPPLS
jgi:hypothetical protein